MSSQAVIPLEASRCPFRSSIVQLRRASAAGWATLAYAIVCYSLFFVWFLYAVLWLSNWLVPRTIDGPGRGEPWPTALAINAGLVLLFAAQHTIMARPAFKRWITGWLPASIERSTFVLAASAAMWLLVLAWRPVPQVVWSVTLPLAAWSIAAVSLVGWLIVLGSSFCVSHFDLFGLRQAWFRLTGRRYESVGFRLVGPYRLVRHPLMIGFLIAFWSAPTMSIGRLFFAAALTGYILIGTWFEERDLVRELGIRYERYRLAVPAFVPRINRKGPAA